MCNAASSTTSKIHNLRANVVAGYFVNDQPQKNWSLSLGV
jgi:hypothetical protein